MHRQDLRDSARERRQNMFDWRDPLGKSEWPNGDWEAAQGGHPRQRAAKGPRKKRTPPKPRQYTIADLERARDRVAAAERRIDNDRTNNPNRGRAGLERAQLELSVIESQLRLRGLLGSTAIKPE
jgi:hypothetical protein